MDDGRTGDVEDDNLDGVGLLERSGAGVQTSVTVVSGDDTQSVLQSGVSHGTLCPALNNKYYTCTKT